jgi:hypothetical protein
MPDAGDLQGAIAALWEQARPRLLARVDALEREGARTEAHTLAGTLGTFGRADAAEAARAAERAIEAGDREALAEAVRRLRASI